ncbi:MAG: GTP-binding protein, partial [Tannerella sp.]|nr:GTP-binding protein [Tannerella sp.]
MKVYQTSEIKNISILGSSGTGKTTLAEAMLYEGGVIKRRGSVKNGSTVCDYFPVEKEYGYSVFSTVFSVEWNGLKLNFIDCPGSDDFIGGAVSALNVTDTALMIINAQHGVEVGTINQFRYTEQFHKPVIFVVNQLDNDKADYESAVSQLKENYGSKVIQIQYPVTCGTSFNAVVDVLKMKLYRWKPEGGVPEVLEIPENEAAKAAELHQLLVEAAAEHDDSLME